MKKTLFILFGVAAGVCLLAQTITNPQPVDWRFRISWEDPNPAGAVASWTVYASNSIAVRMAQTRGTTLDLQPLLNGASAGTYAIFNIANSALGDTSEPSTNLFVRWPGGSGRLRGGQSIKAEK